LLYEKLVGHRATGITSFADAIERGEKSQDLARRCAQ
jgi:hypothetical protein